MDFLDNILFFILIKNFGVKSSIDSKSALLGTKMRHKPLLKPTFMQFSDA